jgi:hypothetical protein
MKVKISNYPNRLICNIHTRYMNKKYGYVDWPEPEEQTRFQRGLELFEDLMQTIYNCTINLFLDRRVQKVKVHIDRWDTWSMDYTLAPIILPMLKQLKETNHGASYVDPKDVPKELHPKKQTKKQKDNGETDSTHFERWDWVLDEMIYAFDCKANKDDVYMRFEDKEEMKAEQERISNGFRLFGKYYENLWD